MSESKTRVPLQRQPICANRRRFSEEFKRDAVRLIVDEQYTFKAAAKAVGISEKSLRRLAPAVPPCGQDATVDELREENRRLRKQLKRAELEREILKKPRRTLRGGAGYKIVCPNGHDLIFIYTKIF